MSNSGSFSEASFDETPIFPLTEVHRFIKDCMLSIGTPEEHSNQFAATLTEADYRGHYAEGLNKLETYIEEIRHGGCDKTAVPQIIKDSFATACVDGNNGLGAVVADFCMNLAIAKSKDFGIGFVVAKGSNSFGIAGIYSSKALREGCIGLSFTNSPPLVAPTGAIEKALGTNPIAMAAPALNNDTFELDMATAAVSVGKIEILSRKRLPVPIEWANPETGALRPLGGNEPHSNYKGFGLGFLVEILCGILSGASYGPNIRKYGIHNEIANIGHCFIAINLRFFAPGFEERLSDLMDFIRNMQPVNPEFPILVPGDSERQHMAKIDKQGGLYYVKHVLKSCAKLAKELNVVPLSPLH